MNMAEDFEEIGTGSDVKTLKLPGAASLYEQLNKLVMVCLRDGRNFFGWLRSFDQYANLTLDSTVERMTFDGMYADVEIGIFVIRGENVMLLGEVDEEKEGKISSSMKLVSEDELRRVVKDRKKSETVTKWPIPEEF